MGAISITFSSNLEHGPPQNVLCSVSYCREALCLMKEQFCLHYFSKMMWFRFGRSGSSLDSHGTWCFSFPPIAFPSNPEIERSGPPVEGEVMNLTCTVHDVFPGNSFHMVWLDGETEMYSEKWPFANGLQNLSSVFSYRVPSSTDREKIITCRVLRELDDTPGLFEEKTASTTLTVHCEWTQFSDAISIYDKSCCFG